MLSDTPGRFGGSDDGGSTLAATQQHAVLAGLGMGVGGFNLGLTSPALAGMPNEISMAQLAQLNRMNRMNPFSSRMSRRMYFVKHCSGSFFFFLFDTTVTVPLQTIFYNSNASLYNT